MKREIKFRAWHPQVKRMFEVGYVILIRHPKLQLWGIEHEINTS